MKKLLLSIAFLASLLSFNAHAKLPVYEVEIKNHKFNPETIKIPKGQKFRLVVKNLDNIPNRFKSEDLNRNKTISGNKKASFIIKPLKSGIYKLFVKLNKGSSQGKIIVK